MRRGYVWISKYEQASRACGIDAKPRGTGEGR